jgi:hypothetical protein
MTATADLLDAIDELRTHATQFIDESFRLVVEGGALGGPVNAAIQRVGELATALGVDAPTLRISDASANTADLASSAYDGEPWLLLLGKTQLAERMSARDDEATLLFFTVQGFHQWLSRTDPFLYPTGSEPDLAKPTTVRVHGLQEGFGGPLLWVLPSTGSAPEVVAAKLPDLSEVHGLIHTNAVKPLRVCPSAYALTWGALAGAEAAPLVRLSACVLSACLVQELRRVDERYEITLRGTKRLSLPLFDDGQAVAVDTLHGLLEAVRWVYGERPETRLRLVMDRLSIDIEPSLSLLSGAEKYLAAAMQQARDSYAFVILERKDAYHKEVRELMKDMKSQADLYAAKVRDLVNSLTRDVLGVLVFIGFSFIGKFDQKNLQALLKSSELALLLKVLASYLVLSFILQLSSQWRDAKLSFDESKTWLDVLQHYSSQDDKRVRFLEPIDKRRATLFVAMGITGAIYVFLALAIWNLPFIAELLLAQ